MTILLYQTDSYLKEFDAEVIAVNPDLRAVALNQTAFYPGGGGQPADEGTLEIRSESFPITGFKKQDGALWHLLGGDSTLPEPGEPAHGILNWDRRYRLMRTHTAMHILCGVAFHQYGAFSTGNSMEPLSARMDLEFQTMHGDLVADIETAINKEIAAEHPLNVRILPRAEAFAIPDLIRTKINLLPEGIPEVRVVEIEGLDLQADGGTHVANTREVGRFRVTDYKSKGAINKRIYFAVEDAA
ncbi:MAG: alanyl-tRNA editing protein [Anaerolineae bacterium]|nr:MAG: alanyl-tRNA editing protein [Anaerolineae bacterium]